MAKWVSQAVSSSVSKRAQTKTSYLSGVVSLIDRTITEYFNLRPEGEDVTVEVLRRLGRARLLRFVEGDEERLGTVKQDVGLLVAIRLVKLFTDRRVLTYREDDGKRVSTRPARTGPPWVNRFTPHRVVPVQNLDRIVLDTNAVRSVIHGDSHALDLEALRLWKGQHPVSIADPAWAELVKQLLDGAVPFSLWAQRIQMFDAVLDSDLPIVPSGREAAAMSGIQDSPKFDYRQTQAYYRAVWHYVSSARGVKDFQKSQEFMFPDGRRYEIGPLLAERLREVLDHRFDLWQKFIKRLASRGPIPADAADEVAADILSALAVGMDVAKIDRLDLPVRILARYAIKASAPEHPYLGDNPNDAIDFDVLFTVSMQVILCTSDGAMKKLAHQSGSADANRLMTPKELLDWLRSLNKGEVDKIA